MAPWKGRTACMPFRGKKHLWNILSPRNMVLLSTHSALFLFGPYQYTLECFFHSNFTLFILFLWLRKGFLFFFYCSLLKKTKFLIRVWRCWFVRAPILVSFSRALRGNRSIWGFSMCESVLPASLPCFPPCTLYPRHTVGTQCYLKMKMDGASWSVGYHDTQPVY